MPIPRNWLFTANYCLKVSFIAFCVNSLDSNTSISISFVDILLSLVRLNPCDLAENKSVLQLTAHRRLYVYKSVRQDRYLVQDVVKWFVWMSNQLACENYFDLFQRWFAVLQSRFVAKHQRSAVKRIQASEGLLRRIMVTPLRLGRVNCFVGILKRAERLVYEPFA